MTDKRSPKESPKDGATSKGQMSNGLAADGTPICYHVIGAKAKDDCLGDLPATQLVHATSIKRLIWAVPRKGYLACVAESSLSGRQYIDFRNFYMAKEGWRPCKEGCIIPIESFPATLEAINAFAAGNRPDGTNDSEKPLKQP